VQRRILRLASQFGRDVRQREFENTEKTAKSRYHGEQNLIWSKWLAWTLQQSPLKHFSKTVMKKNHRASRIYYTISCSVVTADIQYVVAESRGAICLRQFHLIDVSV